MKTNLTPPFFVEIGFLNLREVCIINEEIHTIIHKTGKCVFTVRGKISYFSSLKRIMKDRTWKFVFPHSKVVTQKL